MLLHHSIYLRLLILSSIFLVAMSGFNLMWRKTMSWIGLYDTCNFVPDLTLALKRGLPNVVRGQDEGLKMLFQSFSHWEDSRKSINGALYPLVLVITGPTGVGKNYVSNKIGSLVFAKNKDKCSLLIKGADFQDEKNVTSDREKLRNDVFSHINSCFGNAIIVIDEFQKITPGVLSVLSSAMDKEQASITTASSQTEHVSTKNCIFIFLTDAAGDSLRDLVVRFGERENIEPMALNDAVFREISKERERLQLVHKHFNDIIPFLPLEPSHVREVLNFQFETLKQEGKNKGYWDELVVKEELLNFYSENNKCIEYQSASQVGSSKVKKFSVYGARKISFAYQGPLKTLRSDIDKLVKSYPRKREVMVISPVDETTYRTIKGRNINLVSSDTGKYILMQWCTIESKESKAQFSRLTKLNQFLNLTRLSDMDVYRFPAEPVCQKQEEDGSCIEMVPQEKSVTDSDIEATYDEIESIFKQFVVSPQCSTAYLEPLKC